MLKRQSQSIPKEIESLLGRLVVDRQCQPSPNFPDALCFAVTLHPVRDQRIQLVELFGLNIVQCMVIAELFCAGNQMLQHRSTIASEREVFDEIDFSAMTCRHPGHCQSSHECEATHDFLRSYGV